MRIAQGDDSWKEDGICGEWKREGSVEGGVLEYLECLARGTMHCEIPSRICRSSLNLENCKDKHDVSRWE